MPEINSIYLLYLLIGISAAMFAEGGYLLFYNQASYRKNINRRLKVMEDKPDRESVLVQLRRERGLTSGGDYRLPLINLNQLLLQSGLSVGFTRLMLVIAFGMIAAFVGTMVFDGKLSHALGVAAFCGFVLPFMVLRFLRGRRQKKFGAQFPDAIDIIVRSLRAVTRCRSPSTWWRARCRIRSAASSASSPTRSPTAPTWKPRCAVCFSASAATTCRCS